MIGSVSTSRRAHAFAKLLDDEEAAAEGPVAGLVDAPTVAALSVARQLAALPRPALSAETRMDQRARLTAAAAEAAYAPSSPASAPQASPTAPTAPTAPSMPEQRQRRRRTSPGLHRAVPVAAFSRLRPRTRLSKGLAAGGLTMGVAAGALGGVAAASTDALPGDTLYGLKRGMEDLRLDFAGSDVDRGEVYLDRAATRLNEARRLMERARTGRLDADDLDEIHRALSSMRDDAAEGHRLLSGAYERDGSLAALRALSAFTENHGDTWARLRQRLPRELSDISAEVNGVFDAMAQDTAPLRPLLPQEQPEATATPEATAGHDEADPTPSADASASATQRPSIATASSPAADPTGTPGGASHGAGSASPSPTRPHEDDGLLDGTGLLPTSPVGETVPDTGTLTPSSQPGGTLPTPEVTIPPLVDDLLPRLGLDVPERD